MIENPMQLRALTQDLTHSVWTLGAIGVLLESGLAARLAEARSLDDLAAHCKALSRERIRRILDVAAVAGVVAVEGSTYRLAAGAMPFSQPAARVSLQGDVRTTLMQVVAYLDASTATTPQPGWGHQDAALLQAQGDASSAFAPMLKSNLVATLDGLAERLDQPTARFLDVGAGVASLAIAMCRCWPALRVLGVDPYQVPLELAQRNIAAAGLGDRIELRHIAVDELREEDAFDLAWVPSFFVAESTLAAGVRRVHAALRPGGWLLFPVGGFVGEERARAAFALVCDSWGGPVLSIADADSLLKSAGFSQVRVLPGPPFLPPFVVARR